MKKARWFKIYDRPSCFHMALHSNLDEGTSVVVRLVNAGKHISNPLLPSIPLSTLLLQHTLIGVLRLFIRFRVR